MVSMRILKYFRMFAFWSVVLCYPALASLDNSNELKLELYVMDSGTIRPRFESTATQRYHDSTMAIGQPMFFGIVLSNIGTKAIELYPTVAPDDHEITKTYVMLPDGTTHQFTTSRFANRLHGLPKPRLIQPGGLIAYEDFAFTVRWLGSDNADNSRRVLFSAPGVYQFFVTYESSKHNVFVESNRLKITVTDPLPYWTQIQDAGIVKFIDNNFSNIADRDSCGSTLRDILKDYAKHPFEPWLEAWEETRANPAEDKSKAAGSSADIHHNY